MAVNHTHRQPSTAEERARQQAILESAVTLSALHQVQKRALQERSDENREAEQADMEQFVSHLSVFIAHDIDLKLIVRAFPTVDFDTSDWTRDLAKAVAVRFTASIPKSTDADKLVGPFYRAADLARWRGVTRQAISKQARQRRLLVLDSASGTPVYPAWQFGPRGEPLPGLAEVLTMIDQDEQDPLGSALWLNRPAERFDGRTPAAMLRAGRRADVLRAARQIASANAA